MPRVTSKGQVTIPKRYREQFGIEPESEVEFDAEHGRLFLIPRHEHQRAVAERWLDELKRIGREHGNGMTTDEIMQLTRGDE